jgi:predicted Holliday junction resolvase-like endonuclease
MNISGFSRPTTSEDIKLCNKNLSSAYLVSTGPGDGVYLSGPCDKKDDSQWEMSSKLQQLAEQMKQENVSLKREVEKLKEELNKKDEKTENKLKEENKDLQEQVKTLRDRVGHKQLDVNLQEGTFTIKDVKYKGITLDNIKISNPKTGDYMKNLLSIDIFSTTPGQIRKDFFESLDAPFTVEEGKVSITEELLTEYLGKMGDTFKKYKVKNLEAHYEEGKCKVKGDYGNFIPIPFTLFYSLDFKDNKFKVTLDNVKVAGVLSVPNMIQDTFIDVIGSKFAKGIVEKDKDRTFSIDIGAMLPVGLKAGFKKVTAENGTLEIELGPPMA